MKRIVVAMTLMLGFQLCHAQTVDGLLSYTAECMLREEPTATTDEGIERHELRRLLCQAVQALPEPQRDAFLLHYDEELTVPEVARIVGCPEGTVKSRLATALTTIKKQMNAYK